MFDTFRNVVSSVDYCVDFQIGEMFKWILLVTKWRMLRIIPGLSLEQTWLDLNLLSLLASNSIHRVYVYPLWFHLIEFRTKYSYIIKLHNMNTTTAFIFIMKIKLEINIFSSKIINRWRTSWSFEKKKSNKIIKHLSN